MAERLLQSIDIRTMPEAGQVPEELVGILAVEYAEFTDTMLKIDLRLAELDALRPQGQAYDSHLTFVGGYQDADGPVKRAVVIADRQNSRFWRHRRVIINDNYPTVGGHKLHWYDDTIAPDSLRFTPSAGELARRRMDRDWTFEDTTGPVLYLAASGVHMRSGKKYDHGSHFSTPRSLSEFQVRKGAARFLLGVLETLGPSSQEPHLPLTGGKF